MNYLKTLSIMFAAIFLFGCTREIPSIQPQQSSLSSFVQPVQNTSNSVSPIVSSQSSFESSVPAENGSVPQKLENGWHYTDVKKWWLHGWVKDGQEFAVVFLTGVADKNRIREVLALSPAGCLLKPINVNRLKDTIEDVIDK